MKSKVVIAIVVLLIIVLVFVLLLGKNKTKVIDNTSGETVVTVDPNEKYLERIDIDVGEGYTLIEKKNITSSDRLSVEAIAYKEVSDDTGVKTLVNVYVKNNGTEAIGKNESIEISLFDKDHNLTHRFGGIIEADADITTGNMTIVKTQFLSIAGDNVFAKVAFESEKEETPLEVWKPSGENEFWSAAQ